MLAGVPPAMASLIRLPGQGRPPGVSPKQWHKMMKRFWDTPLAGKNLRRLRDELLSHWSCATELSPITRTVLILRAGLFGRSPAARTAIARRLGIALRRVVRAEFTGVRQLARAGTCIQAGGAALGTNLDSARGVGFAVGSTTATATARGHDKKSDKAERDQQAVRVVTDSRGPIAKLRGDTGGNGALDTLLAFLAVLLVILLAITAAIGGAQAMPVMAARRVSQKPLLFLDVDGVIALRAAPRSLPAGGWEPLGSTNTYIATHAGASIRTLTEHFDVVWASDWEEMANPFFRKRLGLSEDLPALTFNEATDDPRSSDWKIARIEEMAGDRPLAWVDGTEHGAYRRWARQRKAPTLVVVPEPSTGLSDEDVGELLAFAISVADREAARPVVRRVRHTGTVSRS
jgi:hypothetical protein